MLLSGSVQGEILFIFLILFSFIMISSSSLLDAHLDNLFAEYVSSICGFKPWWGVVCWVPGFYLACHLRLWCKYYCNDTYSNCILVSLKL